MKNRKKAEKKSKIKRVIIHNKSDIGDEVEMVVVRQFES